MIVYVVICRGKDAAILSELYDTNDLKGNAPQVTTELLKTLCENPQLYGNEGTLKTYVNKSTRSGFDNQSGSADNNIFNTFMQYACTIPITTLDTADEELNLGNIQEHYFHVCNLDGIFYCCLSDDKNQKDQKV